VVGKLQEVQEFNADRLGEDKNKLRVGFFILRYFFCNRSNLSSQPQEDLK